MKDIIELMANLDENGLAYIHQVKKYCVKSYILMTAPYALKTPVVAPGKKVLQQICVPIP